jgi:hypothetical protein
VDCFARGSFQNLNPISFGRGTPVLYAFLVILIKNFYFIVCSKKESIPKELLDAFRV